jgi:hypothetical protein
MDKDFAQRASEIFEYLNSTQPVEETHFLPIKKNTFVDPALEAAEEEKKLSESHLDVLINSIAENNVEQKPSSDAADSSDDSDEDDHAAAIKPNKITGAQYTEADAPDAAGMEPVKAAIVPVQPQEKAIPTPAPSSQPARPTENLAAELFAPAVPAFTPLTPLTAPAINNQTNANIQPVQIDAVTTLPANSTLRSRATMLQQALSKPANSLVQDSANRSKGLPSITSNNIFQPVISSTSVTDPVSDFSSENGSEAAVPEAPAFSPSSNNKPLNWKEQQQLADSVLQESNQQGETSPTAEQIQLRLFKALSGRPMLSYLGGAPGGKTNVSTLRSVQLKQAQPIQATLGSVSALRAVTLGNSATSNADNEGGGLDAAVITGALAKLRKVERKPVDLPAKENPFELQKRELRATQAAQDAQQLKSQQKIQKGIHNSTNAVEEEPQQIIFETGTVSVNEAATGILRADTSLTTISQPSALYAEIQVQNRMQSVEELTAAIPAVQVPMPSHRTVVYEYPQCSVCSLDIRDVQVFEILEKEMHVSCALCTNCKLPFGEEEVCIVNDKFYHDQCMRCVHCQRNVSEEEFAVSESGQLYCGKHAHLKNTKEIQSIQCNLCCNPIYDDPDIEVAAIGQYYYHISCIRCAHCKLSLIGQRVWPFDGLYYCEQDYLGLFASICQTCNHLIEGQMIQLELPSINPDTQEEYRTKLKFHPHCFNCVRCNNDLTNAGFMWHHNELLCADDYEKFS